MAEFRKHLRLADLVLIGTGASIGVGIFRTPSQVAGAALSPAWILAAWALGGAVTLAGALSFGELGAAMPRAGGQYVWLSEAYGPLVGFLHGWAYLLVVVTGALAALSIVFADYVGFFIPMGPFATKAVAILALLVLAAVNVVGVRFAARAGGGMTVVKLAALGGLVLLACLRGREAVWSTPAAVHGSLGAAMIGVLWSYGGWQHASFAAGEAERPRRDVPRAMIAATAVITGTYVLANIAYLRLLPLPRVIASPHVASDAAEAAVGRVGGALVAVAVAASAVGTAGIYMLTAPRLYWAMAERGLFFRGVAELHPVWRTPARAIVLQATWACLLVLLWGTFENLLSYMLFVDWIFFGLTGAAVLVLRKRNGPPAGYAVPGYPLVPVAFVATSAWFVVSTLMTEPVQAAAGGALLLLGVPVYAVYKRR